ncbi:MAG TPA: M48 family metallopeptidase [Candidatus Synoicihabitans sp.]|nr:M48 family metallopeptidase [Candidatus Synoicihabitans sp.]
MDFFEAQDRAKKRTTRLVVLFILAVLGTITAGYFATIFLLDQFAAYAGRDHYDAVELAPLALWQPQVLGWVALVTTTIIGFSSFTKWLSLRGGGSVVAEMLGGRRVLSNTTDLKERQLLNVVEEMAIASGTPSPAVYVLEQEKAINAFAAGLTTSDAVVAVTRGTLDRLTRDELQGVVGHEFSHILNGDMRLNLKLTSVVYGILVIALMGRMLIHSLRFAHVGGGGRNRKGGGGGLIIALVAGGFAMMLIGYIGYFFGRMIQSAVSRQREYLADAAAVQFTRNPGGLAGALKKLGGLALGGRLASPRAAQFNHAFFAQNFGAGLAGLFSTHPPLPERIRAIEPTFDGKMLEPTTVVDVSRESFRTAGLGPAQAERMRHEPPAERRIPVQPAAIARSVGVPTPAHLDHARELLTHIPPALHAAAADPDQAVTLIYALLLDPDESIRARQLQIVGDKDSTRIEPLRALAASLPELATAARLPLVQIAIGSLKGLNPAELDRVLGTLDELVHADARVSPFEYALQKVLSHHLRLAQKPQQAGEQLYSFSALAPELATLLSILAHAATDDERGAVEAFAAGAARLKMLEHPLELLSRDAATIERLDSALSRLEHASLPIKKRLIDAGSHVIGADGTVRETEAELLRAICAALDCPMPPVV